MLKGCKHYFTMFGMMFCAINSRLLRLLSQFDAQQRKMIPVVVRQHYIIQHSNVQKNQTYQG